MRSGVFDLSDKIDGMCLGKFGATTAAKLAVLSGGVQREHAVQSDLSLSYRKEVGIDFRAQADLSRGDLPTLKIGISSGPPADLERLTHREHF